jgi:NAD-dependent SIR2 family protein deacetylase
MTTLRRHARVAALTDFHTFIHTMLDTNRAVKCLTRNFDCLETRDRPDLSDKVMEIHGRNDTLTCLGGHVLAKPGTATDYDGLFLKGAEVPCPSCAGMCECGFCWKDGA